MREYRWTLCYIAVVLTIVIVFRVLYILGYV